MLTVDQMKQHCNIELAFTEENAWISARIIAAARYVENFTRRRLYEDAADPLYLLDEDALLYGEDIETAMLLLVGHWYAHREAVTTDSSATTLDFAVDALLQPYRIYGI